jgi:DNA-binding response OmpR family regulator
MSKRIVRVLHIEDDHFQHRLLAHLLAALDEFGFEITCAESEREGLEIFDRQGADLIVLDYLLPQGDGLHCLKELRLRDPKVPIIAISGAASLQIAKELVECGADDYLNKNELAGRALAKSVRDVLSRWDAWKKIANRYRLARSECE